VGCKSVAMAMAAAVVASLAAGNLIRTEGVAADTLEKSAEPSVFRTRFECSNGDFIVEVHRDWAPLGVARFEQLVKDGFYDGCRFFRVVPGFVVQFGIAAMPEVNAKWRSQNLQDDPVKQTNADGTICFANAGPNTRRTQLFINLVDNARLDEMGFAPFGRVVEGMPVVKAITAQYGETPQQPQIEAQGNTYLVAQFPQMDYIKKVTILPALEAGASATPIEAASQAATSPPSPEASQGWAMPAQFQGKWANRDDSNQSLVVSETSIEWKHGDGLAAEVVPVSACSYDRIGEVVSFSIRSGIGAIANGQPVYGSTQVEMKRTGDGLVIAEKSADVISDPSSGFAFQPIVGQEYVFVRSGQ